MIGPKIHYTQRQNTIKLCFALKPRFLDCKKDLVKQEEQVQILINYRKHKHRQAIIYYVLNIWYYTLC